MRGVDEKNNKRAVEVYLRLSKNHGGERMMVGNACLLTKSQVGRRESASVAAGQESQVTAHRIKYEITSKSELKTC